MFRTTTSACSSTREAREVVKYTLFSCRCRQTRRVQVSAFNKASNFLCEGHEAGAAKGALNASASSRTAPGTTRTTPKGLQRCAPAASLPHLSDAFPPCAQIPRRASSFRIWQATCLIWTSWKDWNRSDFQRPGWAGCCQCWACVGWEHLGTREERFLGGGGGNAS